MSGLGSDIEMGMHFVFDLAAFSAVVLHELYMYMMNCFSMALLKLNSHLDRIPQNNICYHVCVSSDATHVKEASVRTVNDVPFICHSGTYRTGLGGSRVQPRPASEGASPVSILFPVKSVHQPHHSRLLGRNSSTDGSQSCRIAGLLSSRPTF
jgi:hypothetical protein